jgi:hypothetical protein
VTGYMSFIRPSMVGCRPCVRHNVMGFANCVRHSLIGYSDIIRHRIMGYTSGISSGTVGTITCPHVEPPSSKRFTIFTQMQDKVFSLNLVLKYVQSS